MLTHWISASRPKTLPAAAAPIVVGTALAVADNVEHWLSATLALLSALMIQIGTNLFNDYADFKKGSDTAERTGPVRVTQAGLLKPEQVKAGAVVSFALAVVAGGYLMYRGGLPIVIIGALSIFFGFVYTAGRFSLSYTGLADIFVLIFFGPVAVGGTYYVQALTVNPIVLIAGLGPGLLATAILLVNNIRDMEQDRAADKKTLIVRFGRRFGYSLYACCILLASAIPGWLFYKTDQSPFILIASLVVIPGAFLLFRLWQTSSGPVYNKLLASTARLLLAYSIVFALGWLA